MPSINWHEVFAHPGLVLKLIAVAFLKTLSVVFTRILQPSRLEPLGFRNSVARAWLGTTFVTVPTIFYSEPSNHGVPPIEEKAFKAYIVPTVESSKLRDADAVMLFAHGGGMMIGHPLQYLTDYRRWIKHAASMGKKLVIVGPQYPLSPKAKWPAQREAVLATYRWLLAQNIPAAKVVFAGDSAGANLIALTLLHIRDGAKDLPQPACAVLQSGFFDMSAAQTLNSPHWGSDFMLAFDVGAPMQADALRPKGLPIDTPEISSLLWESVAKLPPQLVIYSSTEILGSDSERWIKRCKDAGVQITEVARRGELHTFAVGWPVAGKSVQSDCDDILCRYIFGMVGRN